MAAITCSKSGVLFSCEHMPLALHSQECSHPMFAVSKKKLIALAGQWAAGRLSPTESYLLYLALLDSTGLLDWRTPASYTAKTPQIVGNNMESMLHIVGKIDVISHPSFTLPRFVISHDTRDLANTYYWIQSWIQSYNDWMEGTRASAAREAQKEELDKRESTLTRLINSAHTNATPEQLANSLAEWAALAGDFPDYLTPHPVSKKQIPLSEYWKLIIRACVSDERIWTFPRKDILELIDHCEDNVINEGVRAHALFRLLRGGLKKYDDYLGFGDVDLAGRTTSFVVLPARSAGNTVNPPAPAAEQANILALAQSAPESEPRRANYPSTFAYLKAKSKWDLVQSIQKAGAQ